MCKANTCGVVPSLLLCCGCTVCTAHRPCVQSGKDGSCCIRPVVGATCACHVLLWLQQVWCSDVLAPACLHTTAVSTCWQLVDVNGRAEACLRACRCGVRLSLSCTCSELMHACCGDTHVVLCPHFTWQQTRRPVRVTGCGLSWSISVLPTCGLRCVPCD